MKSSDENSPLGMDTYIQQQRQQWAAQDSVRYLASIDAKLSQKNEAPLCPDDVSQLVYMPSPRSSSTNSYTTADWVLVGLAIVLIIYLIKGMK